ncbi:hypothetical protein E1293_42790 [Actinomadura darangshiensis]|uniref:Uncharacterized protein n=1 Tax=Actinomadura darangshiensis TaxID=705336 RepID=A0A4R4ZXF7_9ACTN|nr:hypothetical protein [Actinomadura darangshiensis]TDD63645.1 hypothetical protein E1293_42790 [Actinomadura darangshiensis]
MVRTCCEPVLLYSWDVDLDDGSLVSGVSDDWRVVARQLDAVLRAAPSGARAVVRKVVLSLSGRGVYVDLGEIARASLGEGGVVWTSR